MRKTRVTAFDPERDGSESEPTCCSDSFLKKNDVVYKIIDDLASLKLGSPPPLPPICEDPVGNDSSIDDDRDHSPRSQGSSSASSSTAVPAPESASSEASEDSDMSQFDVDLPLKDIHHKVSDAFGQAASSSFSSTKWDKRVHALNSMGETLKSLATGGGGPSCWFRDRAFCWRTTCNVLHHTLRDNVMPVRLTSHDLFCTTFAHVDGSISKVEVHAAMRKLLAHIIGQLGDANLRLHESARACVLFSAQAPQLVGLREVLAMLKVHLDDSAKRRARARIIFGIVDTVNFLLRLGGQHSDVGSTDSWTQEDVLPFVVAGLDDAMGPRIRSSAVALAVTFRVAFGNEALQPVLLGLRPNIRALMLEKFMQFDADWTSGKSSDSDPRSFDKCLAMAVPGLVVRGRQALPSRAQTPGSLPGTSDDEDAMMDSILEETDMVFGKGASVNDSTDIDDSELLDVDVEQLATALFQTKTTDQIGIHGAIDVS